MGMTHIHTDWHLPSKALVQTPVRQQKPQVKKEAVFRGMLSAQGQSLALSKRHEIFSAPR